MDIKNLLEKMLGGATREVVVATISGELLDDWKKHNCEKHLRRMEFDAIKEAFAYEFFKSTIVNGMMTMGQDEFNRSATKAFNAAHVERFDEISHSLNLKEKELWKRTYAAYSLDPGGLYGLNSQTGEVTINVKDALRLWACAYRCKEDLT